MSEKIPYYKIPPVPSPDQLRNSIRKLEEFGGSKTPDKRVPRYRNMLPEAKRSRAAWEENLKRIKGSLSGVDNITGSRIKSLRPKTVSWER